MEVVLAALLLDPGSGKPYSTLPNIARFCNPKPSFSKPTGGHLASKAWHLSRGYLPSAGSKVCARIDNAGVCLNMPEPTVVALQVV